MKKPLLLLAVFFQLSGYSQAPALEWQKTFGATGNDQATAVKPTSDGGYIITGVTDSSNNGDVGQNHGDFDFFIVKISAGLTIEWQKTMGGSGRDMASDIIEANDGGFIATGWTASNDFDVSGNHGMEDIWLIKFSSSGTVEWKKVYGGALFDYGVKLLPADGGYILGGNTQSMDGDILPNHGGGDYFIMKLSETGTIEWQKEYGGSSHDYFTNMSKTADGGYVLCGQASSIDGDITSHNGLHDYWIVKINAEGVLQWQTTLGGSGTDMANDVRELSDGSYIVAGFAYSSDGQVTGNHGVDDAWIVKLSSTGTMVWQKAYGGSSYDSAINIIPTADNGFTILAYTSSNNGDVIGHHNNYWNSGDGWIIKINTQGNIIWQKALGGSDSEVLSSMEKTADGGYIIAGYAVSNDGDVTNIRGSADYWVVKLSPETLANPAFHAGAIAIFPNPASSLLQFQLPDNTEIDNVKVIDVSGKIVMQQTLHNNQINIEKLSSGIYFLQAFSHDKTYQTKFIKQ